MCGVVIFVGRFGDDDAIRRFLSPDGKFPLAVIGQANDTLLPTLQHLLLLSYF